MAKFFLAVGALIFGIVIILILFLGNGDGAGSNAKNNRSVSSVVRQENGQQMIRLLARGGYRPNVINAVAGKDSVLEIETKGTYDCSSSVSIPKLNYRSSLPATGVTKIKIPSNKAIGSMKVLCSMGMYSATINFNS